MRNTLILLVLVSIGLTAPALAKDHNGGWSNKSDHNRVERGEQNHKQYAKHDRNDQKYGHFQKRMKNLRKELRHERRDNRRLERHLDRRDNRYYRQVARNYDHRHQYRAPLVVAPRHTRLPYLLPGITVRIPLIW
jgi:hypothetical protein